MTRVVPYFFLIFSHFLTSIRCNNSPHDDRVIAKPWYVRDIEIGDVVKLPISPVTLLALLYGLYCVYQLFTDKVFAEASHILVTTKDAEEILKQLKLKIKDDPTKFASLASKHSECPSKNDGGSLGKFKRNQMAPPFDRAVFDKNNPVGTTIGPVQTHFGWHLIYIQKRSLE
eukprot:CAMPEP_0194179982 /NCGR_PEP_ID=MMETSP0154-20130528/13328_1 /TAXON_ID=1049557 /ORGANISM="Thalassiothrix antarctica, Strain L6-D1" /LENGTH=171 /DNA_ID=CAMNT_0038895515 /DNA_START=42 /DNA_END=557 /DNA_ORIENTATION=-